jgi:hypothetical protein
MRVGFDFPFIDHENGVPKANLFFKKRLSEKDRAEAKRVAKISRPETSKGQE